MIPHGQSTLPPAAVRGVRLTGLSLAASSPVSSADTILSAFGKLQAQTSALGSANVGPYGAGQTFGIAPALSETSRHIIFGWMSELAGWAERTGAGPVVSYSGGASYNSGQASHITRPDLGGNMALAVNVTPGATLTLEYAQATSLPSRFSSGRIACVIQRTSMALSRVLIEVRDSATGLWQTFIDDTSPLVSNGIYATPFTSLIVPGLAVNGVRFSLTFNAAGVAFISQVGWSAAYTPLGEGVLPGLHRANTFTQAQTLATLAGSGAGIVQASSSGLLSRLAKSPVYSAANVSTDRAFDANATTLDELADVVGTLIADLKAAQILG